MNFEHSQMETASWPLDLLQLPPQSLLNVSLFRLAAKLDRASDLMAEIASYFWTSFQIIFLLTCDYNLEGNLILKVILASYVIRVVGLIE